MDDLKCLSMRQAEPGEMFPPTCTMNRGHTGPHKSALSQRINRSQPSRLYDQDIWDDDIR